jgi:rhodanese-related sulfurtransferase
MQTEQLLTFLTNHWQLALLFFVLVLLLIAVEVRNRLTGIPQLGPSAVTQSINHESATLLDVRSPELFARGHIIGSINRPLNDLSKQIETLNIDKQKPVILVCELGQTAQKAAAMLRNAGFLQCRVLQGGLTAWRGAQLPLVKKGGK